MQGTISEDPKVAIRYRYYEEAPGTVTLPAGELVARLPGELSRGGETGGRIIEIPCGDLLAGNTPRIALNRLQELAPDLIQIPEGRDPAEMVTLPPGWIALHFKLVTRREELPPEEGPLAPATAERASKGMPSSGAAEVADKKEGPKETRPAVPKTVAEAVLVEPLPPAVSEPSTPKEGSPSPANDADFPKPHRGLFSSLPIFRRPAVETSGAEVIKAASESNENDARNDVEEGRKETAPPVSVVPRASTASLALEPLWKLDPQDQLADPTALQALFMTEEKLTLERVISKAGELPGLKACVLAHGDKVLCTSNTASGIDLKTLSGQAMTMLGQIRESTAGMGLGAVPAVTLHAEQGALSFLHNGELCLLVLHADRGFVPGVRERLQEMLGHLTDARPALPGRNPAVGGQGSKDA